MNEAKGRAADAKGSKGGADWLRFLATWARDPKKMGAVASSSRAYCAMMVRNASIGVEGPILELGPGLGVVTRALLEAGVDPARITSIEYDPHFAETLKSRFPRVNVVWGDGFNLDKTLGDNGATRFSAILFAIPILHMKQPERQALFSAYVRRLKPGGNLTQLSYAPTAPVKGVPGAFEPSASPLVWANIPPARVWIYTPTSAPAGAPSGQAAGH